MAYYPYKKFRKYNNHKSYRGYDSLLDTLFELIFSLLIPKIFHLIKDALRKRNQENSASGSPVPTSPTPANVSVISTATPLLNVENSSDDVPEKEELGEKYGLKDSLLTPAEKNFLIVLKEVVGGHLDIVPQVQLSRIVSSLNSNSHFTNWGDLNRINSRSIDFVLYDKEFTPHLAIELDDRSHWRPERIKRDHFVDEVLRVVGIPIIHIPVAYSYDTNALRQEIFNPISPDSSVAE